VFENTRQIKFCQGVTGLRHLGRFPDDLGNQLNSKEFGVLFFEGTIMRALMLVDLILRGSLRAVDDKDLGRC
jgi:hypothetical protein